MIPFGFLAGAALAEPNEAPDPLFQDQHTLQVTISAPLTTLVRKRPDDDYLRGTFRFTDTDDSDVTLDLKIRTRGHFRHQECDYPPLLLNLDKDQAKGTLFDKQNKLKLVIHCGKSERYAQTVLREYIAYRVLSLLTEISFKVRLLYVSYENLDGKGEGQQRYAFLIEHKNRLAERLDLKDLEIQGTSVAALQPDHLNLTSVFEYMIGNTDFSPIAGPPGDECCHNYVLFGDGVGPIVAVPYDFDQSGFVDAPYAKPDYRFRINSVRQRLYRGRCVNNEHLDASLKKFKDARQDVYALIRQQEGLDSAVRGDLVDYIDDFYDVIDDPRQVRLKLIDECI